MEQPSVARFGPAQPAQTYSFARRKYDACETQDQQLRSTGPGRYMFAEANTECKACFLATPKMRLQKRGDSELANYGRTDVESDLFNITRVDSHCARHEYNPQTNVLNHDAALHMPVCNDWPVYQDTRLENPACNLRGTGVNRFEWPCRDPQKYTEVPFTWGVQARMVAKDNYRPCIPTPVDVTPSLPAPPIPLPGPTPVPPSNLTVRRTMQQNACMGAPGGPAPNPIYPPGGSVQWRSAEEIARY